MKTKRKKSVSVRVSRTQPVLGNQPIVRNVKIYRNVNGRIGSSTSHTVAQAVDPPISNLPSPDAELEDWGEQNLQDDGGGEQNLQEDGEGDQVSEQLLTTLVRPLLFLLTSILLSAPVSTNSGLATISTAVS